MVEIIQIPCGNNWMHTTHRWRCCVAPSDAACVCSIRNWDWMREGGPPFVMFVVGYSGWGRAKDRPRERERARANDNKLWAWIQIRRQSTTNNTKVGLCSSTAHALYINTAICGFGALLPEKPRRLSDFESRAWFVHAVVVVSRLLAATEYNQNVQAINRWRTLAYDAVPSFNAGANADTHKHTRNAARCVLCGGSNLQVIAVCTLGLERGRPATNIYEHWHTQTEYPVYIFGCIVWVAGWLGVFISFKC